MKRNLVEELERIHSITYGKKVILEDDIVNKLLKPATEPENKQVSDDPKKADLLNNDPENFFKNLEQINEPLTQQDYGSMEWHKGVESFQIALELLGYHLSTHGVDGLFGPETAEAVRKFKKDFNLISESTSPYDGGGNVKIGAKVNTDIDVALQSKIDAIASEYGKPFKISSGYRDPEYNAKIGGASKSQHLLHNAVDIVLDNATKEDTLRFVEIASKNGIGGIGVYSPGILHIDIGPRRSWGSSHGRESVPGWAESTIRAHEANKINDGYVSNYDTDTDDSIPSESTKETVTPELIDVMIKELKQKGVTKEDLAKYVDFILTGGSPDFTDLDLENPIDVEKYAKLCDAFIIKRPPNLLKITGQMMAKAAANAFKRYHRYVPPELALAQIATEGGIGNPDANSRPIRTKNPYNVGNWDNGKNTQMSTVESGIQTYYDLIARDYLGKSKTAKDLLQNFVNKDDLRYAGENYERVLTSIAKQVNRLSKTMGIFA